MPSPAQTWEFSVVENHRYRFLVQGAPPPQAAAVLEWCNEEPKHATHNGAFMRVILARSADGWQGEAIAPPGTTRARILVFHWRCVGVGAYECPCRDGGEPAPRLVRVAVAHQRAPQNATLEGNVALMCQAVQAAGEQSVQLLCMTENFPDRFVQEPLEERALFADDARLKPLFDAIRAANLHAVFALHEKTPQGTFIAAWLVSPQGEIIGRYNKCNLTLSELENGLRPGDTAQYEREAFDTPLGKIGILICWDAWFPESATRLTRAGAEIVCFPLAGDGAGAHSEHVWRARALDNQVFWLASATANCSAMPSRVIAPSGEVLAETSEDNSLAIADIDLNAHVETYWLSVGPYLSQTRNVYDNSRIL